MAAIDILLVNPGNRAQVYQGLGSELAGIETPIWAGLMASFVRGKGYSVDILDANALGLSAEEAAARADELDPLLTVTVVYGHQPSASTQNVPAAGAFCTALKRIRPDRRILIVGGHVAALPERTLQEEDADWVALGEGLHTMHDLVEMLKAGSDELHKVRDLLYNNSGLPTRSRAAAPLLTALDDEMPGVAYDLMPMDRYRAHNWHAFGDLERQPYASMYTTLGCPYSCSFCCIQAPFKSGEHEAGMKAEVNSYRFWDPQTVITKLGELVENYGVRNVKFADEMFVLNRRHVSAICDLIIERGYDLNIWAYARVDTVADGMAEKLKAAGFNWLCFGIESGSERVRDDVDKRFNEEQIAATMEMVQSAGINIIGNYMFGLPEDDMESMQATLDLAMDLNNEFVNFYCAMAYPGSSLHDQAVREGWQLPKTWSGYSQHSVDTMNLPTNYLTSSEVLRFRDDAFQQYFANPAYLAMITAKFGHQTAEHVRAMAAQPLERHYASSSS